jgi:hypothetical protein
MFRPPPFRNPLLIEVVAHTTALSQRLAKLRAAGIVATRRDAQTVFYRVANTAAESIMKALADVYCGGKPRKGAGAERRRTNADQIDGIMNLKKPRHKGRAILV